MRGAVRETEAGGEKGQVVIDVAELLRCFRDTDGRAEGADDGVDGKGVAVLFHLGEAGTAGSAVCFALRRVHRLIQRHGLRAAQRA